MSSVRFAPVQWLRALAATLVVAVHAANLVDSGPVALTGKFFPTVPNLGVFGVSGVDLFFVISGFVMAHSLSTAGRDPVRFLMLRWRPRWSSRSMPPISSTAARLRSPARSSPPSPISARSGSAGSTCSS